MINEVVNSKKCAFCKIKPDYCLGEVWVSGDGLIMAINDIGQIVVNFKGENIMVPIKHCPHCGKKLEIKNVS